MMRSLLRARAAQRGVTLIELMVALVLGLVVAGGIVTVFLSTSSSNRVQTQMAHMQEDGRFAIGRLTDDLSMATGMYCNNTGGIANPSTLGVYLDGLRTPKIYAKNFLSALYDNTTVWNTTSGTLTYPAVPTAAYQMPSFLFMRGYNCTGSADCTPIKPTFLSGTAATAGTAIGNRVIGTDVLTLRYLDASRGWRIGKTSQVTANPDGTIASISIVPDTSLKEPPVTDFKSSMALLADCSSAQVFAITGKGTASIAPDSSQNFSAPLALQPQSAPRVFDFATDMRNVTYYVQVVSDDGTANGVKTGALMRRVNGTAATPDQEIIRGVERLTFRYGVEDATGGIRYLTADQVDAATSSSGSSITCPPTATGLTTGDPGCLWRAVKSIEVSVLLAGQDVMPTLTTPELSFVYTPDASNGTYTPVDPTVTDTSKLSIRPSAQGFQDKRLRRQFTALVMLRNYNP